MSPDDTRTPAPTSVRESDDGAGPSPGDLLDAPVGLDAVEPRISYVIARLERAIRKGINERVRPYGLTTLQYTTLSVLRRQGRPLSNAQLARRAYVTPQAMGEVIEKLEKMHFLKRVSHPNHRRVYPAVLLPAGIQVLEECDARVAELEAAMLHDLDDAQRLEMARALTSAVQALGAGLPQHVR
jgi:DNA-binding MarR family transcriptional regulator